MSDHLSSLSLCGFRACGKTTVAAALADRFDCPWADLDAMVVEQAGHTIAKIFEAQGEAGFRALETECLRRLVSDSVPAILSLGGGAVLSPVNQDLIAAWGPCVWLDASEETIARRMQADTSTSTLRPALTSLSLRDEISHTLRDRRPIYERVSQKRITTDEKSVDEIVDEIVSWIDEGSSSAK